MSLGATMSPVKRFNVFSISIKNNLATACLVVAMTFVAGCGSSSNGAIDDSAYIRREQVFNDFSDSPDSAAIEYRKIWLSNDRLSLDRGQQFYMLAVAGELIKHDKENYNEYYEYIVFNLNSGDREVLVYSINALSGAVGRQSIDLILDFARDPRRGVSDNAVIALRNRLAIASSVRQDQAEFDYIHDGLDALCSGELSHEMVKDLCSNMGK